MAVPWPADLVLQQPTRRALHEAVAAAPGITFRALVGAVGRPSGTVRHHLDMLLRSEVLREQRAGCALAYVLATDQRDAAQLAVLRAPGMALLRDFVANHGRVCQREVLDAFDAPRGTTQHRLKRLVQAGLVRVAAQGRHLFYEVPA